MLQRRKVTQETVKAAAEKEAAEGKTQTFCFVNGKFVKESSPEASVPINDRGFQFGDGIFLAALVVNGVVELWNKHLDHLAADAAVLNLRAPVVKQEWIRELVKL